MLFSGGDDFFKHRFSGGAGFFDPEEIITAPLAFALPHCSKTSKTAGAGTAMIAKSSFSLISKTEEKVFCPCTVREWLLTIKTFPVKPPSFMFFKIALPTEFSLSLAPMTATALGLKKSWICFKDIVLKLKLKLKYRYRISDFTIVC
jgi:hypothetical protein